MKILATIDVEGAIDDFAKAVKTKSRMEVYAEISDRFGKPEEAEKFRDTASKYEEFANEMRDGLIDLIKSMADTIDD